jgi:hypothetical protein
MPPTIPTNLFEDEKSLVDSIHVHNMDRKTNHTANFPRKLATLDTKI